MNGRIYDPKLGRMLQADPFVQDPKNSQSLNRYSYVLNNPLSYTDPSGYFVSELFNFARAAVRVIASEGFDVMAWADLVTSALALINSFSGQAAAFIPGIAIGSVARSGVSLSMGQGSRQSSPDIEDAFRDPRIATLSGTGSELTGAKFANGAVTMAMGYVLTASRTAIAPRSPGNQNIGDLMADQVYAREALEEAFASGALDSSRAFDSADAAAIEVLSVIGPISEARDLELGGFITKSNERFSYGEIFVGLRRVLPQLVDIPQEAAAGFHTHPDGARYFSIEDTQWVNDSRFGTKRPLYLIGNGQIRVCGVASLACHPDHAGWLGPYNPANPSLQGTIVK